MTIDKADIFITTFTIISKTIFGTVYNMSLDNMAVLVPSLTNVEKMPVSRLFYQPLPRNAMPNPLYPAR